MIELKPIDSEIKTDYVMFTQQQAQRDYILVNSLSTLSR